MIRTGRITAAFNIRPGEARLVSLLLLLDFFFGLAFVSLETAAYSLFLNAYGAEGLPILYIATAVVVTLASAGYMRLIARWSFGRLAVLSVAAMAGVALLMRGISALPGPLLLLLPVGFELALALATMIFWTIVGRVLDVRQSKRLIGLVGSGRWIAITAGGLLVPVVVAAWGTASLFVVGAASFSIALAAQFLLVRSFAAALEPQEDAPARADVATGRLWSDPYVARLFGLVIALSAAYIVLDNIFFMAAEERYPDPDALASFLGTIAAVVGMAALFINVVVTGRLLGRYGVRVAGPLLPLLLCGIMLVVAALGTMGVLPELIFGAIVLARLVDSSLTVSIEQPTRVILAQPLAASTRARFQAVSDGVIEPVVTGVTGLVLLALSTLGASLIQLVYLFVALAILWLAAAALSARRYPWALARAIAKRNLGELARATIADKASVAALEAGLTSPYPDAVLYCMRLLQQVCPEALWAALPRLLAHPERDVRRQTLLLIENAQITDAAPMVELLIEQEQESELRAIALRTMAALSPDTAFERLTPFVNDADPSLRQQVMIALLRYSGLEGVLLVGQQLLDLMQAADPSLRALAAVVLGEAGIRHYSQPLVQLLNDPDPDVQRAALLAAGKIQHERTWPVVVSLLGHPAVGAVAQQVLEAAGEPALAHIRTVFGEHHSEETRLRAMAICGKIGGSSAVALLESQWPGRNSAERLRLLQALHQCQYRASADNAERIQRWMDEESESAGRVSSALLDVLDAANPVGEPLRLLADTLEDLLHEIRERLFLLISFQVDAQLLLRARDQFTYGSGPQQAYALEVIDTLLPQESKRILMPLLDDRPLRERLEQLAGPSYAPMSLEDRLRVIIRGAEWEAWPRACAIDAVGRLRLTTCQDEAAAALQSALPLVHEAAAHALAQLAGTPLAAISTADKVRILNQVGLFSSMPQQALVDIACLLQEDHVGAGQPIIEKGQPGSSMYILARGRAYSHDGGRVLNDLYERDFFGEMALLDSAPRAASVTAREDCVLLRLEHDMFFDLITGRPAMAGALLRVLAGYLRARVHDLTVLRTQAHTPEAAASHREKAHAFAH